MRASHSCDPGSIPGRCNYFYWKYNSKSKSERLFWNVKFIWRKMKFLNFRKTVSTRLMIKRFIVGFSEYYRLTTSKLIDWMSNQFNKFDLFLLNESFLGSLKTLQATKFHWINSQALNWQSISNLKVHQYFFLMEFQMLFILTVILVKAFWLTAFVGRS
jgi:hypothetical protein